MMLLQSNLYFVSTVEQVAWRNMVTSILSKGHRLAQAGYSLSVSRSPFSVFEAETSAPIVGDATVQKVEYYPLSTIAMSRW